MAGQLPADGAHAPAQTRSPPPPLPVLLHPNDALGHLRREKSDLGPRSLPKHLLPRAPAPAPPAPKDPPPPARSVKGPYPRLFRGEERWRGYLEALILPEGVGSLRPKKAAWLSTARGRENRLSAPNLNPDSAGIPVQGMALLMVFRFSY